jgi:hypothetical protein
MRHPVQGQLARIVVRWFRHDQPLYLTVHALGTGNDDEGCGLPPVRRTRLGFRVLAVDDLILG